MFIEKLKKKHTHTKKKHFCPHLPIPIKYDYAGITLLQSLC